MHIRVPSQICGIRITRNEARKLIPPASRRLFCTWKSENHRPRKCSLRELVTPASTEISQTSPFPFQESIKARKNKGHRQTAWVWRSVDVWAPPLPTGTLTPAGHRRQDASGETPVCLIRLASAWPRGGFVLQLVAAWFVQSWWVKRSRMPHNLAHQVHFLSICRAIMEHKELLKVPWDWQIGKGFVHLTCWFFREPEKCILRVRWVGLEHEQGKDLECRDKENEGPLSL